MENVLLNLKNEQSKKNIQYVAIAKKNKFGSLSHVQLFVILWTVSNPPGSSVHGILQARVLEWVAIPFCRRSSQTRNWVQSPALQVDSLPSELPGMLKKIEQN